MKIIKEVCFSPWDFILYETDKGFVINVYFSASAVDFSRSFRINEEEAKLGLEELKKLSEKIRNNYESYTSIEIIPSIGE